MAREDTFRGQVFENTQNSQKLLTVPKNSGIEKDETIRAVSLGKFHEAMSPENQPGHYIHEELRGAMRIIREAVDQIPEEDRDKLAEKYDFFKKWELGVGDNLSAMMTAIDKHYAVMEKGEAEVNMDKAILEYKTNDLVDELKQIDSSINEKRKELKEEHGVEEIEYEQGVFNLVTTESGDTVEVPAYVEAPKDSDQRVRKLDKDHDSAPENLQEFAKQNRLLAVKRKDQYRETVEQANLKFDMEVVGMDALVMKIRNGDYVAELPFYFPEEHNLDIYKEEQ